MTYAIKFVDFIDHDYRRKYRVIERIGDVEFAGGMVGDEEKSEAVEQVEAGEQVESDVVGQKSSSSGSGKASSATEGGAGVFG